MKRVARYSVACLFTLLATAAQAVPVTFQYSTVIESVSAGLPPGGGLAPFEDPFSLLGTSVVGSFTIETDAEVFPGEIVQNGALITVGLFYWNPVVRHDVEIAGQHFSFVGARPPFDGGNGTLESNFFATDLTAPLPNPFIRDGYDLDTSFGLGQLAAPNGGLELATSLTRAEFDFTQIQSTDMLLGLTTPAEWHFFFTIFAPATGVGTQVHGMVTDLRQVVTAPEPGTAGLFVVSLAMLGLATRRRRQPAASFIIDRSKRFA